METKKNPLLVKKSVNFIVIILLWVLSLLGIIFSLFVIFTNVTYGLLMLFASIVIIPPFRRFYLKKITLRLRYTLIISFVMFWTGFITFIATSSVDSLSNTSKEYSSSNSTTRILPKEVEFISESPTQNLSYKCAKVRAIKINGIELSGEEIKDICNRSYILKLQDGETVFDVEIISAKGTLVEKFNITFNEQVYLDNLKAKNLAEAQASTQRSINEFANKYDIKADFAGKLLDIFPDIDVVRNNIESISKTSDWANGERYSMVYDSTQVLIYVNKNGSISSINLGDIKLYQENGKTVSINNYLISYDDLAQLKLWAEQTVEAALKAPSTAEFPGNFLDPYIDWGFSREENIYKISSYVDSQNSFGAMIRGEFYMEFEWNRTEKPVLKTFVLDGDKII